MPTPIYSFKNTDLYQIWLALTGGIPVVIPNPLPVSVTNFSTLISLIDADNAGAGIKVLPQWSSMVNALNANAAGYPVRNPAGVPFQVVFTASQPVDINNFVAANTDLLNRSAFIQLETLVDNFSTLDALLRASPLHVDVDNYTDLINATQAGGGQLGVQFASVQPISITNFLSGLIANTQTPGNELYVVEQNSDALPAISNTLITTFLTSNVNAHSLQGAVAAALAGSANKFVALELSESTDAVGAVTDWNAILIERP